jgi:hypothetical protein
MNRKPFFTGTIADRRKGRLVENARLDWVGIAKHSFAL